METGAQDARGSLLIRFHFKSFRSRILTFFLGLLLLVQFVSLYLVDIANTRNANNLIGESLLTTVQAFHNRLDSRNDALTLAGRTLSGDYAFKVAVATSDPATTRSALTNHRHRIGADLMLLLGLNGKYRTISGIQPGPAMQPGKPFPFPDFLQALEKNGHASGIIHFNNRLYSIIAVPLLAPVPTAWIVIGFEVNGNFIQHLHQSGTTQISLAYDTGDTRRIQVSTLQPRQMTLVEHAINNGDWSLDNKYEMHTGQSDYLTYISNLRAWGGEHVYAILQRDRAEAMAPYYRVRLLLIIISLLALLLTIFGSSAIASSVTRPVRILVAFARDIQHGDYTREVNLHQQDELGQLGQAFNNMSKGLFERDKVRNLLGKVISPEIAEELIRSDVQLGGEEKEITILFTDLRGFTSLSENRAPAEVLNFLNEYLTRMTAVIDRHGGVVDKYIGDAIMALFGAPLEYPDHASRAVACALEMVEELERNNAAFEERGWPQLAMGIGIHTGKVVVGNMGSRDRLNYTAIGDGVNLASRLESATKELSVPVIVSAATMQRTPAFQYRELGVIKVKGKQRAVKIFTPVKK